MLSPTSTATTQLDGTIPLAPPNSRYFRLVPDRYNIGGFPIIAIINGDNSNPISITSADVQTWPVAVTQLELTAGGAWVKGDAWTLEAGIDRADVQISMRDVDGTGATRIRKGGGVQLFNLSSETRLDLGAYEGGPRFFIVPGPNGAVFSADPGQPWDVSRFDFVRFNILSQGASVGNLSFYIEFVDTPEKSTPQPSIDSVLLYVDRFGAGSLNNFGAEGGGEYRGSITLGAGADSVRTSHTVTSAFSPWVRFVVECSQGDGDPMPLEFDSGKWPKTVLENGAWSLTASGW